MSDSDILRKITAARTGPKPEPAGDDSEVDEKRAYAVLRGGRGYASMLDIRQHNGNRLGLPYHNLLSAEFDPPSLVLEFVTHTVRLVGRNLAPIYDGVMRQAVLFVQGGDARAELQVPEEETFISAIDVAKRGEEEPEG